jgi:cysteine desulfurase
MNFLIKGLIHPEEKPHIVTSNVEHACIEKTLQDLKGCTISYLPAGKKGTPSIEEIEKAIHPETKLLVFSAVNSETGVKQDLEKLGRLAQSRNIFLIIDGVALLGKESFHIPEGVTAMAFSAHKFHGPKGAGFVFLRAKTKIKPLLTGGGQEYGLRSGTENITAILGCAKAVCLLQEKLPLAAKQMEQLRNHFETSLIRQFPFIRINGEEGRICNISNLCFFPLNAETLLIQLDLHGILASQGSACSSGALEPSRILTQMGLSPSEARSSIRFSLSRNTTLQEISHAIDIISKLCHTLTKQGSHD